jgi:hypothetical protein
MAIFDCEISKVTRGKAQNVCAAAAYQSGEKLKSLDDNMAKAYRRSSGSILHTEMFGWSGTRQELWNAVEKSEKRCDAQLAKKFVFALPKELSVDENVSTARDLCERIRAKYDGVAVDLAVHNEDASKQNDNFHGHILITFRAVGADGSLAAKKNRNLEGKKTYCELRKLYADTVNHHLELTGRPERISEKKSPTEIKHVHHGHDPEKVAYNEKIDELLGLQNKIEEIENAVFAEKLRGESEDEEIATGPQQEEESRRRAEQTRREIGELEAELAGKPDEIEKIEREIERIEVENERLAEDVAAVPTAADETKRCEREVEGIARYVGNNFPPFQEIRDTENEIDRVEEEIKAFEGARTREDNGDKERKRRTRAAREEQQRIADETAKLEAEYKELEGRDSKVREGLEHIYLAGRDASEKQQALRERVAEVFGRVFGLVREFGQRAADAIEKLFHDKPQIKELSRTLPAGKDLSREIDRGGHSY